MKSKRLGVKFMRAMYEESVKHAKMVEQMPNFNKKPERRRDMLYHFQQGALWAAKASSRGGK